MEGGEKKKGLLEQIIQTIFASWTHTQLHRELPIDILQLKNAVIYFMQPAQTSCQRILLSVGMWINRHLERIHSQ